ncbi:MAG: hypothetical protein EA369_05025 [Bradymonadales bacterium]|nr:MAG: hypothetical protein EA369_05025 [Bradymonadales bacterium]
MNPDLLRIRNSRFFRDLPERAFSRAQKYLRIRSHSKAETVIDFKTDSSWRNYFGYVIRGKVLFLTKDEKPIGLAVKDEFFLGRAFKIGDYQVDRLIAASENCLLVYIPKEIVEILSQNSQNFSEMIEEIYDSIFERSELIASDTEGLKHYQEWLTSSGTQRSISSWLGELEKKRESLAEKQKKKRRSQQWVALMWSGLFLGTLILAIESFARLKIFSWAPSLLFLSELGEFHPGSEFNVTIGIVGICLLVLSNVHSFTKLAIRKLHWKINYQNSVRLHMFLGSLGAVFVLFHSAGYLEGYNVAHLGVYAMVATIISGLIGQLISAQIPRSLQGERRKVSSIHQEIQKLERKASLLLEEDVFKTSAQLFAPKKPPNLWGMILFSPSLWFRHKRIKMELARLGLSQESAALGGQLILDQIQLEQKIRSLEVANIFFKRWMWIHQPLAYLMYFFAFAHIIIVTFLV